jgi:hypothetical protein
MPCLGDQVILGGLRQPIPDDIAVPFVGGDLVVLGAPSLDRCSDVFESNLREGKTERRRGDHRGFDARIVVPIGHARNGSHAWCFARESLPLLAAPIVGMVMAEQRGKGGVRVAADQEQRGCAARRMTEDADPRRIEMIVPIPGVKHEVDDPADCLGRSTKLCMVKL